jgi:hypothetical protein
MALTVLHLPIYNILCYITEDFIGQEQGTNDGRECIERSAPEETLDAEARRPCA